MLVEYDIKSAFFSIIIQGEHVNLHKRKLLLLIKDEKHERNVFIGKMVRDNDGLSDTLHNILSKAIELFEEKMCIVKSDIVFRSKDSLIFWSDIAFDEEICISFKYEDKSYELIFIKKAEYVRFTSYGAMKILENPDKDDLTIKGKSKIVQENYGVYSYVIPKAISLQNNSENKQSLLFELNILKKTLLKNYFDIIGDNDFIHVEYKGFIFKIKKKSMRKEYTLKKINFDDFFNYLLKEK